MKIWIGSDHAGIVLKEKIVKNLINREGVELTDIGPNTDDSVDYPDYAEKVSASVSRKECDMGILICGSGIGMSIVANKFRDVRAALCHSLETAELSRKHNNANVLVIGERIIEHSLAILMTEKWLATPFDKGRHENRLVKITALENRLLK